MSDTNHKIYRFKSFLLDVSERQLFNGNSKLVLTPKTFDVLVHLVENAGHLVLKDDLMNVVWPDTFVEELNVPRAIHHLRKALGHDKNGDQFVETVPTKGYRFTMPVVSCSSEFSTPSCAASTLQKHSLAVLPFKNLSEDPSSGFYEIALAEAVIAELAQISYGTVCPISSVGKYRGISIDALAAGRELRADRVLSADFLLGSDRLRVNAQLLDVASGEVLRRERIDVDGSDFLTIESAFVQSFFDRLSPELLGIVPSKSQEQSTDNDEAWEEYLTGRDNFGRFIFRALDIADCQSAIQNFKRAIELDSQFALAYSGLGACYANRFIIGAGKTVDYTLAESIFSRAFAYDANLIEARVLSALIKVARGKKDLARSEILSLSKQSPRAAPPYFVKGILHRLDGEYNDSLKAFEKLARLDPAARAVSAYNRARIHLYLGDCVAAMQEIEKGEKTEPNHPRLKIFRSSVYYESGDRCEAISLMSEVLREHPEMHGVRPLYATYLADSGRREDAIDQLSRDTLSLSRSDSDMAYWVGSTYSILSEKDLAFRWLARSVMLGNQNATLFENDKNLDTLRNDPQFPKLMKAIRD